MMRPTQQHPQGTPNEGSSRRMRMHHLYYLLAGFDLITVTLSLILINQVAGSFEDSVRVNNLWAARMNEFAGLGRHAAEVNAPGNDVFESGDPAAESARMDSALVEFESAVAETRQHLQEDVLASEAATLLHALDNVAAASNRMVEESRAIFAALSEGDTARGGEHMAVMDRRYAELNLALADLTSQAQQIQEARLETQAHRAAAVRRSEWALAGLIVLMIAGVTFYGHRLATQARRQAQITEELVRERTAELEESHQRLRAAERLASIGTLAAGLGHDMNNVLFPVRCRLDVIEQSNLSSNARGEVREMRASLDFLQQLSDGLRLLAIDPEREEVAAVTDLASWIRQAEPLLRTALPRAVSLEIAVTPGLPAIAVAPHRVTQAVFNLVVNAGEAIEGEGRASIRIFGEQPGASDAASSAFVRISVSDTGQGMTEAVRRHALDPFFTTKRRRLSTGLGLALVQGVAAAAGGRVEINSEPGMGATVSMILPTVSTPSPASPGNVSSRARAVISLHDSRQASLLAGMLTSNGCDVALARSEAAPVRHADLWILDTSSGAPADVEQFLDGAEGRHVILVSDELDDSWDVPGVIPLRPGAGLSGTLAAIEAALGRSVAVDRATGVATGKTAP